MALKDERNHEYHNDSHIKKLHKIVVTGKDYVYHKEVFLYMKALYHQGMIYVGKNDLYNGLITLRNAVRESQYIFQEVVTPLINSNTFHSSNKAYVSNQKVSSVCLEPTVDTCNENDNFLWHDDKNLDDTKLIIEDLNKEFSTSFDVIVSIGLLLNDLGVTEMRLGLLEKAYSHFSHGRSIMHSLRSKIHLSEEQKAKLNDQITNMIDILQSLDDNHYDLVEYIESQARLQQIYGKEKDNEIDFVILSSRCKLMYRKHKKKYEGILSKTINHPKSFELAKTYNDLSAIRNMLIIYTHQWRRKISNNSSTTKQKDTRNREREKLLPIPKFYIDEEYRSYIKKDRNQERQSLWDKDIDQKYKKQEEFQQFESSFSSFTSSFLRETINWKKPFILSFRPQRAEEDIWDEESQSDDMYQGYKDTYADSDFIQHLINTYSDVPVDYYPHGLREVGNSPVFVGLKEASLQLLRAPLQENNKKGVSDSEMLENLYYRDDEIDTPQFQQSNINEVHKSVSKSNFMHNLYSYHFDPFVYDISQKGSYIQWNLQQKHYIELLNHIFSDEQLNNNECENRTRSFFYDFLSKHAENWLTRCFPNDHISSHFDQKENFLENNTELNFFRNLTQNIDQHLVNDFGLGSHWWMLLIGEEDAGMFIHTDTLRTSSWQYQIQGTKEWRLCSPNDFNNTLNLPSIHSGKAGFVDAFEEYETDASRKKGNGNSEEMPQIEKQLNDFDHVTCYGANILPRELLYYPRDFWHQTNCRSTPSIALSGSILDPLLGIDLRKNNSNISSNSTPNQNKRTHKKNADWNLVFNELMRECDIYITPKGDQGRLKSREKPRVFFGNEDVCQHLQRCGQEILPLV